MDKPKIRKAIAALDKKKEHITLAKLAKTTGYRYGQLYCETEFRRFAKIRVNEKLWDAWAASEEKAAVQLLDEAPSSDDTAQPAQEVKTNRPPGSAKLDLQISEWLRLEMKFPIPEKKRRLVHAWLLAALDFAGECQDDQAHDDHGSDAGGAQ